MLLTVHNEFKAIKVYYKKQKKIYSNNGQKLQEKKLKNIGTEIKNKKPYQICSTEN